MLLVPVAGISQERFDHYCSLFERGATDLPVEVGEAVPLSSRPPRSLLPSHP